MENIKNYKLESQKLKYIPNFFNQKNKLKKLNRNQSLKFKGTKLSHALPIAKAGSQFLTGQTIASTCH